MKLISMPRPRTAWRPVLLSTPLHLLESVLARWLSRPDRRSRTATGPLPAPVLQFGLHVDGQPVRGTRWGFGPLVYLTPDATGRPVHRPSLVRSLLSAGYGVVVLEGFTRAADRSRVLRAVTHRQGAATAVVHPADPDAGTTLAGLLADRPVGSDRPGRPRA